MLIGAHRLVWTDDRAAAPKPKMVPTLALLGVLLCFGAVSAAASAIRAWSEGPGVLATLGRARALRRSLAADRDSASASRRADGGRSFPAQRCSPSGSRRSTSFIAYVITPWALAKQGTYGALGVAAALLVGLFLVSRLVVASAVVNATLWERRARRA